MDIAQGGEREEIDWRQMRRSLPPSRLYAQTSEWMNTLAQSIRPAELCRQYPRIANDLCALWEFSKMGALRHRSPVSRHTEAGSERIAGQHSA